MRAGLPDEVLVCTDEQGRAREVGLARHEHVFDTAGAAVRDGPSGPGDARGAGRLLAAANREDLGVARGSSGVEELCRVGPKEDIWPPGGQVELVEHEPGLLAGGGATRGFMIPHFHRRQVSHDEDIVRGEVGVREVVGAQDVKLLGVGLLLGRDVGVTVPDPRHRAARLPKRLAALQRLWRQRYDVELVAVAGRLHTGDDVAGRCRAGRGGDDERLDVFT